MSFLGNKTIKGLEYIAVELFRFSCHTQHIVCKKYNADTYSHSLLCANTECLCALPSTVSCAMAEDGLLLVILHW